MKLPHPADLNTRSDFKTCNWRLRSKEEMLSALDIPTAESHPKAAELLGLYSNSDLDAVKNLGEDPVTEFLKAKVQKGGTIQCPLCHTVYDIKVRNCKNAQCSVINIRAAKATQQDVVHEVHRQRVQEKRSVVIEWKVTFEEGGEGVAKKQART